jgi:hypothetical protein
MYVCIHVCQCMYVNVCMSMYVCEWLYVCMCVCMYVFLCSRIELKMSNKNSQLQQHIIFCYAVGLCGWVSV